MLNILLWGLLIVVGVPAIIIAVLAIAICLNYRKINGESEDEHEKITTNSTDG